MTTTYDELPYCAAKPPLLRCAPRDQTGSQRLTREITAAAFDVHLLPCKPPVGVLEPAPRTSLGHGSARAHWEGFWCVGDERYYTRCRRDDGTEQWYRVGDDAPVAAASREARVIPLRRVTPDGRRILAREAPRMVVFGSLRSRKTILIGTSRRPARRSTVGRGGGG